MKQTLKYGVLGNLGFRKNSINGQTIKTRCIKDTLDFLVAYPVNWVDTAEMSRNPFITYFLALRLLLKEDVVCVALQKRGLKYVLPLCLLVNMFRRNLDLRFFAIGGRLADFAGNSKLTLWALLRFQGVYVETQKMKRDMELLGCTNCEVVPNFRFFTDKSIIAKDFTSISRYKFLFMARVCREKGVEIAIQAIKILNDRGIKATLDIYGPIQDNYESVFFKLVEGSLNVTYHGSISPYAKDFYQTVSSYDVMLLPTYYRGEGFPGTFIDAFIGGLPVVASDWNYNRSLIHHDVTGLILKENTPTELAFTLERMIANPLKMNEISRNVLKESRNYDSIAILSDLLRLEKH